MTNLKKIFLNYLGGWRWPVFLASIFLVWLMLLIAAGRPIMQNGKDAEFEVKKGEGLREIAQGLEQGGLIRSAKSFVVFAALAGRGSQLKPGLYAISSGSSTLQIVFQLSEGSRQEVEVVIPEGASVYLIDKILSEKNVLVSGELIKYVQISSMPLEGRFFPDTYLFYVDSTVRQVVQKMTDNFEVKTAEIFEGRKEEVWDKIILASLLEKEVPEYEDRRIVAGLLEKRLKVGMPLQVDATICYAKQARANKYVDCHPLQNGDFKIDSEYNTYLNRGLPPQPIGSPGFSAIKASFDPKPSLYWYYLSDPKTGKTIFSRDLEEHALNKAKYLR
ncbi:MAG TPA: endolytic transglycosylase MltG [Candidatus Paceibacterota bacterium]